MSRIHDALSRARGSSGLSGDSAGNYSAGSNGAGSDAPGSDGAPVGEDLFVSPWSDRAADGALGGREVGLEVGLEEGIDGRLEEVPVVAKFPRIMREQPEPEPALHVVRPVLPERFSPEWRERLTVSPNAEPSLVEQFRRLAATLIHRQRAEGIKSVMVASANSGDGKTLTALNLALVLSESYRDRVLLIDGDLRRPTIGAAASVAAGDGLNEAVNATDDRQVSLVQMTETLTLLPAGIPDADPLSGLTSSRMRQLLEEAAARFDWLIIDSPPVGATADASLLGAMVDTAVLVVRAGHTPHAAVQSAIDALGRERIHGVVLNAVDDRVARGTGGEYGYYPAR